jgi:hypothetical protein
MADPRELEEAADAILKIRRLPGVQRHPELAEPLCLAEEWARKEYRKVTEQTPHEDQARPEKSPSASRSRTTV